MTTPPAITMYAGPWRRGPHRVSIRETGLRVQGGDVDLVVPWDEVRCRVSPLRIELSGGGMPRLRARLRNDGVFNFLSPLRRRSDTLARTIDEAFGGMYVEHDGLRLVGPHGERRIAWEALQCRVQFGHAALEGPDNVATTLWLNSNEAMESLRQMAERSDAVRAEVQRAWGFAIGLDPQDPAAPRGVFTFRRELGPRTWWEGFWVLMFLFLALGFVFALLAYGQPAVPHEYLFIVVLCALWLGSGLYWIATFLRTVQIDDERITVRMPFRRRSTRLVDIATIRIKPGAVALRDAAGRTLLRCPRDFQAVDGLLYLLWNRSPDTARILHVNWWRHQR